MVFKEWFPVELFKALVKHTIGNICAILSFVAGANVAHYFLHDDKDVLYYIHLLESVAVFVVLVFLLIEIVIDLYRIVIGEDNGHSDITHLFVLVS
jgi:multisubunit Na+/H+ antiporter MnhF subunit